VDELVLHVFEMANELAVEETGFFRRQFDHHGGPPAVELAGFVPAEAGAAVAWPRCA
jgi:hypothetical protein